MKIIILVRILWTAGAQKIAIKEAKELTAMGYDVQLVFLRSTESRKNLQSELDSVNYKIFAGKTYVPRGIYSAITGIFAPDRKGEGTVDYDLIKKFAGSIKKAQCDYLICHDPWAGVAGLRLKKRYGIPYSVYYHEKIGNGYGIPVLGYLAERTERNVLENADRVLGVTDKVATSVGKKFNVNCIADLPGMDRTNFLSFEQKENIILASAVWGPTRKPEAYLDIIALLPDFKLYFVGRWLDSNELEKFKHLIDSRKLTERVILKDSMAESDLSELYAKAKFSLRFGTNEWGVGTSTIESISHLTPVIVSSLGISDLINAYGGGFVLDTLDPNKVAELIEKSNNKASYDKLQAELIKITSLYTWRKHSELLVKNSSEEQGDDCN